MSVTVEKTTYSTWGNCLRISDGKTELFCTTDFGPNIIRCAPIGKPNIFFEDKNDRISKDLSAFSYKGDAWHIFGGHRLWVSPEIYPYTYYPATSPVDYEIIENGVILRQCNQEFNNLKMEITVTMADDGEITLLHRVKNTGAWTVELAPWALSVLAAGGVQIIPQADRETGLLANRVMAIWPYTDMSDKRVTWGKNYTILRQDKDAEVAFKIGTNNEKAYSTYFINDTLFVKKYDQITNGNYPDYGVSFETYTSNLMMEMETLGELKKLAPGDETTHTERWHVYDGVKLPPLNEADIERTLKQYAE